MSVTGPIRMQIGPAKKHVKNHIDSAKGQLQQNIPTDITPLGEYLEKLRIEHDGLSTVSDKLRLKHDTWVNMLTELKDQDELNHYEASCEEIMDLLHDSDDLRSQLGARVKTAELALNTGLSSAGQPQAGTSASSAPLAPPVSVPPIQVQAQPQHSSAFKAPKIKLPTFDGDYMEFKQFWGIFESSIHNRTDMTNTEKFTYLLSQLEGDAKRSIARLMVNDDNYDVAVAIVKSRYDRADERIVTMLYSEFHRLQPCSGKTAEKQRTLDECEQIFRGLEAAGEDINSNKSMVFSLLSKFPVGMVKDLQRYHSTGANDTLNEVREALRKSIIEEEATAGVISDIQSVKPNNPGNQKPANSANQAQKTPHNYYESGKNFTFQNSAMPAMNNQRYSQRQAYGSKNEAPKTWNQNARGAQYLTPPCSCYFCNGDHFNNDCDRYTSARDRQKRLSEANRCIRCLKTSDHAVGARTCPVAIKCIHCRSNNDHASALCFNKFPERSTVEISMVPPLNISSKSQETSSSGNLLKNTSSGGATALNRDIKPSLFQTAKTTAINHVTGEHITVRIAMDTMSSRSYVRQAVSQKLGLKDEHSDKLFVSVFGTTKTLEVPTSLVEFEVVLRDGTHHKIEANTTRIICQAGAFPEDWSSEEKKTLNAFKSSLADDPFDTNDTIDVLLGANEVWNFIEGPRQPTQCSTLFFIPSKFGLMLSGESQCETDDSKPAMLCITESPCRFPSELGLVSCESKFNPTYPDIDEFWDLEKIGITDSPTESDDDKALEKFQQTVTYQDGRYQVTLPWIEEKKKFLPSNYNMAYDRFRSLTKRLRHSPELLQSYREILNLQDERGIIEKVPLDEIETSNTVHYLPHHPVIKESNTTRIRIVYDAAAKKTKDSFSLNECLMRGPVILPDLCQLLMRVRTYETVVISDIEKAFLQVDLQRQERDVTRFLWFKDDTDPSLPLKDNIGVRRYKRVTFGVICSPFLLAATIEHHLTAENSEFAESLRSDIYVDNVISGLDHKDHKQYYHDLKDLFKRAGMNIQEFCSNSKQLMQYIPERDHIRNYDAKVLGLRWDSQGDDTLRLIPSAKFMAHPATKRNVLKSIASIFDPLGFYQPVLLPAKCFLQKLWNLGYDWDHALPDELQTEWKVLAECLPRLFDHRIPRRIGHLSQEVSIAVFSDASKRAYATAVYLRCRLNDGSWTSNLIFSKTRLSPSASKKNKNETINLPRLELLGAVIGARAGNFCRDGLKIPEANIDFFIDSQCVLHWINGRGLLKRFVANRVEEVRKTTNCKFHYVPSKENPSDLATRGKLPEELFSCSLWWHGPQWLTQDSSEWPNTPIPAVSDKTMQLMESEAKPVPFGPTLAAVEASLPNFLTIDPNAISSFPKLLQVSALCLKFLKRKIWNKLSAVSQQTKPCLQQLFSTISDDSTVTADDYCTAKRQWVKCVQQNRFSEILEVLRDESDERPPQIMIQLALRLDDRGLIRCHGRFENADLPESARYPLLLPKGNRFTILVVEDVHLRTMHAGVSHTLSQVRQEYWIPHGRALVRQILQQCLICRRYRTAKPFKLPPMPPWPAERVSRAAPFQSTGLDYFGPITVKVNDERTKMWVCLFTCLATRAIHLEAVMDFSAQEFLHCLIRFTSRRGVPSLIISDNAAQFTLTKILGDQAWKRVPHDDAVTSYAATNGIEWKFITELAPWQGGFYERLVGLVKTALRTSIRNKLLSWTDLITLLAEAEAVVNSRPITYVGDDLDSDIRAIRPCDFLIMRPTAISDSPDGSEVKPKDFGDAGKRLVSIWKQRCRTLNKLWRQWHDDYLLSLRERRKVSHKSGRSDVNKVPLLDQVVLICDSDVPRGHWKLARINSLVPGRDGRIRSAELKLANGTTLRRPLNHLVPLEVEQPTGTVPTTNEEAGSAAEPASAVRNHISHDTIENDNDDFLGFSEEDVQRTIEALSRFNLSGLDPVGTNESA